MDRFGDPDNFRADVDWGVVFGGAYQNFRVTGMGWDVTLEATSPSWLSELALYNDNSSLAAGVFLRPGISDSVPGTGTYSSGGIVDLVGLGLDYSLNADNLMRFEIFETFDDFTNGQDGTWVSGDLVYRFEADLVPEPATMTALGLGIAALAARRRRK